ncbi:MAG: DNA/RNA nuclease SfsA [SAR202 cluster bacterium]|nr:DNA/RNA nuclease SfsA [SAR202 cluster bacterium]
MKLPKGLKQGHFVSRVNRFLAVATCEGREVAVHVANSGRMAELFQPGNRVILRPEEGVAGRKTRYDLVLVEANGTLVSADARLPSTLLREAIEAGRLPEFSGFERVESEVTLGDSRIDLLRSSRSGRCYVEAKSVTLVVGGAALFPDAPTACGQKHLRSLISAVSRGHRAAVAFVVQRPDADVFSPNQAADPEFCGVLENAVRKGVEAYAYTCSGTTKKVAITGNIPVVLS